MQLVRNLNIALWSYLFASDFLNPVALNENFWSAKASQAVHLNRYFEGPHLLIRNGVVVLGLWFAADLCLRSLRWSSS
jgi:hypothetical protein